MGSNLVIFLMLLAIAGLLFFIFIRLTDLVNLMSVLVQLVSPRSEQYDKEEAEKKVEESKNPESKNQ